MVLSHRHRFIFFCNGRTATTSVEQVLEPLDEGRGYAFEGRGLFLPKHIPPAILRALLPAETWRSYFKFVFVRNPFSWVVSQWKYNFQLARLPANASAQVARQVEKLNRRVIEGRPIAELARTQVFSAADIEVLFAFLRDNWRTLPHTAGKFQAAYVLDADGAKLVDFVGRYETLADDYARIAARLGLPAALPRTNWTRHGEFASHYTAESAAAVARLWKTDFEALGYPAKL